MTAFLIAAAASFAFDVPPWAGTTLGAEDTVPPPWTVPVAASGTFSCWEREHVLGGAGLVASIRSAGEELLAAPVSVEMNGKTLSFAVSCATQGISFAEYDLVASGGDAPVRGNSSERFEGPVFAFPRKGRRAQNSGVEPNGKETSPREGIDVKERRERIGGTAAESEFDQRKEKTDE